MTTAQRLKLPVCQHFRISVVKIAKPRSIFIKGLWSLINVQRWSLVWMPNLKFKFWTYSNSTYSITVTPERYCAEPDLKAYGHILEIYDFTQTNSPIRYLIPNDKNILSIEHSFFFVMNTCTKIRLCVVIRNEKECTKECHLRPDCNYVNIEVDFDGDWRCYFVKSVNSTVYSNVFAY